MILGVRCRTFEVPVVRHQMSRIEAYKKENKKKTRVEKASENKTSERKTREWNIKLIKNNEWGE